MSSSILNEQLRCRDWLRINGHEHSEARLARMGASDWVMEEVLQTVDYQQFLRTKSKRFRSSGFSVLESAINISLFYWQVEVVQWALRKGRAAIFAGCGLGKTAMQLEWANQVCRKTGGNVLILAPLAVAEQTCDEESPKFGIPTTLCRKQSDCKSGINVTNYEMLSHFDPTWFSGVVIDESSILKSFEGATKQAIIDAFSNTPYRMACTATPAPNDYMELGNHAEFLGVMTRTEMLSMFFVHDGGDTGQWRLKGHAETEFWKWVCSWAVVIQKPSDLGYPDDGYELPIMRRHQITIPAPPSDIESVEYGDQALLFGLEASTLQDRRGVRRDSIEPRVKACADLVNAEQDQWIVWCGLNDESAMLATAIPGSVEVTGSDSREFKTEAIRKFQRGETRVIVSKISIFGFGLNLQNCHKWAHVGISDSFEAMYQGDRRCWRFGQTSECDCYIITSELEGAVVRNIERKERDFELMSKSMVEHMRDEMNREVHGSTITITELKRDRKSEGDWTMVLGDGVEELAQIDSGSIHYSIFSPPFASLYTYSANDRDLGNCIDTKEFMIHFDYIVRELKRVIIPGRLVSFHCMLLPASITKDGFIGIKDFRGDLIRLFESHGFIFHSEVVIWKDPLVAASRTHALGLAHKQIVKDAAMCRQGIPDYLITMRVPGKNPEPVEHKPRGFERYIGMDDEPQRAKSKTAGTNKYSHEVWQRYASPVWMDINPSNTLQRQSAREDKDERHICPLQLQVIERAIELWTNPGDLVMSPFAGIGSEGFVALQTHRRFIGFEIKESYYIQAVKNLENASRKQFDQSNLFDSFDGEIEDVG